MAKETEGSQDDHLRIQVNQSTLEQSPQRMSHEIKKLFRQNPGCNPYRILAQRNVVKQTADSIHLRQQIINKLSESSKTAAQTYLEDQMRKQAKDSSLERLADTVNVNINLTVSQYGTVEAGSKSGTVFERTTGERSSSSLEIVQP